MIKTERGQFTFYASFAVALKRLRDPAERCAAYDAIIDYALRGAAPDLDALPDAVAIAFELIRPNLDSSRRRPQPQRRRRISDVLVHSASHNRRCCPESDLPG